MKNKTFLFITIFAISVLVIPQMTFASWWKPNTWKIFNRKSEVKTEQKVVATSTTYKTESKEAIISSTISKSEDISNVIKDDANLSAESGKLITSSSKEKQESVEKQKIVAMQAQIEEIKRSIEQTLKNQKDE